MQENYFFELSKYSAAVQEHCSKVGAVQPERAKNEVVGWIEDGCRHAHSHHLRTFTTSLLLAPVVHSPYCESFF